jgi:hypothetical protein
MHLGEPSRLLEPARLDHLSRELAGAAGELAGLRSALQARAAGLQWHSEAGRAFSIVLQELLGQLGQSGARLGELSSAVSLHRQRASGRAAALARLAQPSLELVERAVRLP